ncbi:hypothetical protein ACFL5K_00900 [Gemmatimonadota bacterium]
MKTSILFFCLLLAATPSMVKEFTLARTDDKLVAAGDIITLKTTAVFNHEACDQAAANTSFYAKGAVIVERSEWQRIDKYSFYRILKVRIGKKKEAQVTAVITKHEDKIISQVIIPVGK